MKIFELNELYNIAVYLLVGVIMIIVFLVHLKRMRKTVKNGIEVEGIVFDLQSGDNITIRSKYPIIRFLTKNDMWVTKSYDIGMLPTVYKKGQKVTVIYSPDNPKEFILKSDDKIALIPFFVLIVGIGCLAAGIYKLVLLLGNI
jgi:hypothetical protein